MINDLLSRLTKVRSKGKNTWTACCPAHNDTEPSLAIALTGDGRILLKCFAGCEALEIVHATGLELKDLFPHNGLNPYGKMQQLNRDYEQRTKRQNEIDHAKIVMALYESDKEKGKKLTRQDRESIMQAFELLRHAHEN